MKIQDEYLILRVLKHGALTTTYKVRHRTLGYVRTIKVLLTDIDNENEMAYQTFLNECRALLMICNGAHPNIVHINQPRLIGNKALIEMDYVRGCTLNQYLKSRSFMPIDEVMRFIREIGGALAYCHYDIYQDLLDPVEDNLEPDPDDATHYIISDAKRKELVHKYRVIHNDLHSNNIMRRDYDGSFVLLDFELALNDESCSIGNAPEYKAPENWESEQTFSTQSNVYSFGILLYEALTGRVPFVFDPHNASNELEAWVEIKRMHLEEQPTPIEPLRREAFLKANPGQKWEKDYPDWLEQMVMKCLAKNLADRYTDAYALMNDFNTHI